MVILAEEKGDPQGVGELLWCCYYDFGYLLLVILHKGDTSKCCDEPTVVESRLQSHPMPWFSCNKVLRVACLSRCDTSCCPPLSIPGMWQRLAPAAMAAAARCGPLLDTGVSALCYEMMSRTSVHDDSVTSAPTQPISARKVRK